jgi:hypothetical protein
MPAPERRGRYQKAVLWEKTGRDRYNEPTTAAPVEISVRWENRASQQLDPQGNTIRVDATVIVNQDIAIGSVMWEGELLDFIGTGSDGTDTQTMEVVTNNVIPDLKNRARLRTVGLVFYRDTLPEQT